MKPADLIFVRGHDIVSRAIEDITDCPYSHVAGYVKDNELIEAQWYRKVGYQTLDHYDGLYDVYTCDQLTDTQRKLIIEYATKRIGTRYDYLLIAWEALRYLAHITLPYHNDYRVICSTLWSDAYRYAGIDLCPGIRYPTPADLAQSKLLRKV
jgi:uncharacterized protein YycO